MAWLDRTANSIKCSVEGILYEFDMDEPLSSLLKQLGANGSCPCHLYSKKDGSKVRRRCKMSLALVPGSRLVVGESSFILKPALQESGA